MSIVNDVKDGRNDEEADRSSEDEEVSFEGERPKEISKPIVNLKEAIYLNDVINNKGIVFEVDESTMDLNNRQNETSYYDDADIVKYMNPCFEEEEDDGTDRSPFEQLARKMEDISGDGGILKLLKVTGSGDLVPEGAIVTIHYSAFLEYGDETYDSSRLRGAPLKISLNSGSIVLGLEKAIYTMRRKEIATFLVRSDYGYGSMGCPPRIPGDSTILFNVELLDYIDYAPAAEFENLSTDEQKAARFEKVVAVVKSEISIGNTFMKQDLYGKAYHRYRRGVRLLENCTLRNQEDEDISQPLLKKLYLNLAMCCEEERKFTQSLAFCTKMLKIEPNNIKALYRRGVVKTKLQDYEGARVALLHARRLSSTDRAITKAILDLNEKESKYLAKEKLMCSLMFGKPNQSEECSKIGGNDKKRTEKGIAVAEDEFIKVVRERLAEFISDDRETMPFPGELTHPELVSLADLVEEFGLDMERMLKNGSYITVIMKLKNGVRQD